MRHSMAALAVVAGPGGDLRARLGREGAARSRHRRVDDRDLGSLIVGEAFLLGGGPTTAFVVALTGAAVALLTTPLREERLWWAGAIVVSATSAAVLCPDHATVAFLHSIGQPRRGPLGRGRLRRGRSRASHSGAAVPPLDRPDRRRRCAVRPLAGDSRPRPASVRRLDRGRLRAWARRGERPLDADRPRAPDRRPDPRRALLRYGGLALFGLSLAKIFLYDLSTLNSAARALSFIAVGALVLAGGFFLQRLSSRMGPSRPRTP